MFRRRRRLRNGNVDGQAGCDDGGVSLSGVSSGGVSSDVQSSIGCSGGCGEDE